MTREDIMEKISTSYVKTICNYCGYTTSSPESDYGIDLEVGEISKRATSSNKIRYFDTNRRLGFQLKATSETSKLINFTEDHLTYKLDVKNYNDLVNAKDDGNQSFLILIVMPPDKANWVNLTTEQLEVRKRAYWFTVDDDSEESDNASKVSIKISREQIFNENTISDLFKERYGL